MKRLYSLIIVLLFPCLVFADNWAVVRTNKAEYPPRYIFLETDIICIQEGEYLVIRNDEKRQMAIIVIPGEKTVRQGIEEAKMLEQERINKKNIENRDKGLLQGQSYLFLNYSDYFRFWREW